MKNKETNIYTERLVKEISAHPYICAFLACLFIDPFFFGSVENIPNNALFISSLLILFPVSVFLLKKARTGDMKPVRAVTVEICAVVIVLCFLQFYAASSHRGMWHFAGGCVMIFLLYCLSDREKFRDQMNSFLIMGTGFFLKLYYVIETSVTTRQNDVYIFDGEIGHAGYIEYILHNFHVPDFDVRDRWQFCHPPLHHFFSAVWIFISEKCFLVGHNQARESVQMLTLFYSVCIIISAYKIFRYFGLKGMSLYIPLAVVSFHPAFILLSGSINNDVLSVALMTGAVVAVLDWYKDPSMKNIMKIALCIGLGMMAKLTAALVAPPVAIVFLVMFIKNFKTDRRKYIIQFLAFGAVCAPLGLWYEVRNYIKWRVPILYVQELDKRLLQYIGNTDFVTRITDFSGEQFKSVFEQWAVYEDGVIYGYNEHNPLIALFKTSLFGEAINAENLGKGYLIQTSEILFWLTVVMSVFAFVSMIVLCVRRGYMEPTEKALTVSFFVIMIANFYKMSYDYPFTCTMNFRYITPTVIMTSLFAAKIIEKIISRNSKLSKAAGCVACALAALFVVCSVILYASVNYYNVK